MPWDVAMLPGKKKDVAMFCWTSKIHWNKLYFLGEGALRQHKCTFIPSCTSTVVYIEDEDSILIIPSGPIFSNASAMRSPTYSSLPADTEATAEIWNLKIYQGVKSDRVQHFKWMCANSILHFTITECVQTVTWANGRVYLFIT